MSLNHKNEEFRANTREHEIKNLLRAFELCLHFQVSTSIKGQRSLPKTIKEKKKFIDQLFHCQKN